MCGIAMDPILTVDDHYFKLLSSIYVCDQYVDMRVNLSFNITKNTYLSFLLILFMHVYLHTP